MINVDDAISNVNTIHRKDDISSLTIEGKRNSGNGNKKEVKAKKNKTLVRISVTRANLTKSIVTIKETVTEESKSKGSDKEKISIIEAITQHKIIKKSKRVTRLLIKWKRCPQPIWEIVKSVNQTASAMVND